MKIFRTLLMALFLLIAIWSFYVGFVVLYNDEPVGTFGGPPARAASGAFFLGTMMLLAAIAFWIRRNSDF